MVVCSLRLKLVPVRYKLSRKCARIRNDLFRVLLKRWICRLLQRGGDTCNSLTRDFVNKKSMLYEKRRRYVIVRATLACRKHSFIDALLEVFCVLTVFSEEYQSRTRPTKSLVTRI